MSTNDLIFKKVSDGETIYEPDKIVSTSVKYTVTNLGDDNLTNLGFYIKQATNVGDVDNPADYPPHTDYQDLLTWGTRSDSGVSVQGGIKVTVPTNSGSWTGYVTRSQGALSKNKIEFIDLAAGDTAQFTVEFETPPLVSARRFFVDLVLE